MATFDVAAARRDGLDDATIKQMIAATGATPSIPLGERQATPGERFRLSFGTGVGKENFIRERGITNVNKPGFDAGDITSKAGGLLPILGGSVAATGGAVTGGILGAPAGPVGVGIGAITAGAGAGAIGQAQGEVARQKVGQALGVSEGINPQELKEETAIGAVAGGLGPVVGKGISLAAKSTAAKSMLKALNPSPTLARVLNQKAFGTGRTYFEEFVERGYVGTIKQMMGQAKKTIQQSKPIVDEYIKANPDQPVGDIVDVINPLKDLAQRKTLRAFQKGVRTAAEDIYVKYQKLGGKQAKLTLSIADKMRGDIDAEITRIYKTTERNFPAGIEALEQASNTLRQMVNKSLPPAQREARQAEHVARKMITATQMAEFKKSLLGVMTRQSVGATGAMLGTVTGGLVGLQVAGTQGAFIGGTVGGTVGHLGSVWGTRALSSTPVVTATGQLIRGVGKVPPTVGQGILNILSRQ